MDNQIKMDVILARLRSGAALGPELAEIQWRFSATIHSLRKEGFGITSKRVQGRVWEYTLVSEPKGN